jgi:hypothetical protein
MIGIIGGVQAILEHKRTEICYRCWKWQAWPLSHGFLAIVSCGSAVSKEEWCTFVFHFGFFPRRSVKCRSPLKGALVEYIIIYFVHSSGNSYPSFQTTHMKVQGIDVENKEPPQRQYFLWLKIDFEFGIS